MDTTEQKKQLGELLRIAEKKQRILEIQKEMAITEFWQDREKSEAISKELSDLNNLIETYENSNTLEELSKLEIHTLFNGKYDPCDSLVSLHAGAGGTESQDWAEMLLRMYERWAQKKNFTYRILELSSGEEAGIKSATILIEGLYSYGFLKGEYGVHRLVRLSPFDADHARHTSFALVEVIPQIKNDQEILIDEKDLRIDVYRASGHGGQGVNTTDSAVRITHIPSGIVVACQNERSQQQNRQVALKILKSRLAKLKDEEDEKKKHLLRGEFKSAEWGNQIRSYVLHPYKLVKDHRTNLESTNAESILDGNLDEFMMSYLKYANR